MPKGLWLILPAAFIDLAGAGISWAFIALGSVLGTVGGGAGGYLAGQAVCNHAGFSWVSSICGVAGATVGAIAGTTLNAPLASIGMPLGFALGYAIQICLGLTFGIAFIILPLAMMGMIYPKYLFIDIGKFVPVLGWLPFWSTFVVCSVIEKRSREKKRGFISVAAQAGRVLAAPEAYATQTLAGRANASAVRMGRDMALTASTINEPKPEAREKFIADIRPPQRNYERKVA